MFVFATEFVNLRSLPVNSNGKRLINLQNKKKCLKVKKKFRKTYVRISVGISKENIPPGQPYKAYQF